MTVIGVRALKQNASEVLTRVNAMAEPVEVSVRGQVVGVIVPKSGYRIVREPDPVPGGVLMERLYGKSRLTDEQYEAFLADLADVRATTRYAVE